MSSDTLPRSEETTVAATAKVPYALWVRAKRVFIERPDLSFQQLLVEGLEARVAEIESELELGEGGSATADSALRRPATPAPTKK